MPHRNKILMNRADMARAGFRAHQRVTVQGEAGELQNLEIISGEIRSGTPAFKRVPALVRAGRGAVAAEVAGSLSSEYHTLHHS